MLGLQGSVVASLTLLLSTAVGPDIYEGFMDAGSTPATSRDISQTGFSPQNIAGMLSGLAVPPLAAGADDFEDMYLVYISDPQMFRTEITPGDGLPGFETEFVTMLWIFAGPDLTTLAEGVGVVGGSSLLLPGATDGGAGLIEPGLYYLAMTGVGNVPVSMTGEMFSFVTADEISSADGPGGGDPFVGWTGPGVAPMVGSYTMGVDGFGIPCIAGCVCDVDDLVAVIINWFTDGSGGGDYDCSGFVDVDDLIVVILGW